MRTLSIVIAVLALAFFASSPARAGDLKEACKADKETYCKGIAHEDGAVRKCLVANKDKLSEACQTAMKEKKEKADDQKEKCKADVDKFCKGVTPGQGAIHKCLKEHASELSSECKPFMAKEKEAK